MNTFPEINRERRGHAFYEGLEDAPDIYETEETDVSKKMVIAHFFNVPADWYLVELNESTMEAFGFVIYRAREGEWGYFDLPSLESLDVRGLIVERDLCWTRKRFSEIKNMG